MNKNNIQMREYKAAFGLYKKNAKRSGEKFIDLAPDAIVIINDQSVISSWNDKAEQMFGWSKNEIIGKKFNETLIPQRHREEHKAGMKKYLEGNGDVVMNSLIEITGLKKNGSEFPMEVSVSEMKENEQRMFIGFIRDISERKKNQLNIQQLAWIVESSEDAIIYISLDMKILKWNKGAEKIYGYTSEETIGRDTSILLPPERLNEDQMLFEKIKRGTRIAHYETVRLKKGGSPINISLSISAIKNLKGAVTGIAIIGRDISIRKSIEKFMLKSMEDMESGIERRTKELTESNRQLQLEVIERKHIEDAHKMLLKELRRNNKELEKFAYITSHDLKAPLRAIGSIADWLYSDYSEKLDNKGKQQLLLLKSRVMRMNELIMGMLTYVRIDTIKNRENDLEMNKLLRDLIRNINCPPDIEITIKNKLPIVFFNKTKMIQVFENLIGNSIKYMNKSRGKIWIKCSRSGNFWKFTVGDNGPGIEKKYHEKIFNVFQTLLPRDEKESVGIGLAITKKIIENSGGKIWINSAQGKGSVFHFTIPKFT